MKLKTFQHIIKICSKNGKNPSSLPSSLALQYLWHNKYIKIDDKTIFSSSLSSKGINSVDQLFQNNYQIKK